MSIHMGGAPLSGVDGMVSYDGPVGGQQEVYESPAEIGEIGLAHPGLFVFDVSYSTQAYISAMNAGVDKFACKLRQNPDVASSAWLGMVSFADDARTEFPLSRLADPSVVLPTLSARGSTNYAAAFQSTLDQLRADLPQLTDGPQGRRKVFRPTIYMVTDGYPNVGGDWRVPLNELRTRSWRPNIFVFGYGDADRAVIREIASEGCAYFAKDGQTPESMFDAILAVILRSQIDVHITATANAAAAPGTAPVAPPPIDPATIGLGDQLQTIDPIGTID